MDTRQWIMRLLIGGLIPAIVAAGLPLPVPSCASVATGECSCCQSHDAACCQADELDRPCCQQAGKSSCCQTAHSNAKCATSSQHEAVCRCGGTSPPVPTAPVPTPVKLADSGAFAVISMADRSPVPALGRSARRNQSALLPSLDLPTALCSLVI